MTHSTTLLVASTVQPVLFIPHGASPCFTMDRNPADASNGFDHGMFIPLKLMFSEADIPVVQLSLREDLDPAAHLAAGKALSVLREEGWGADCRQWHELSQHERLRQPTVHTSLRSV